MFTFYFTEFVGQLDIQSPTHAGIHSESPIVILYTQKEDLTKYEILRRFNRLLNANNITFLRPLKELRNEWLINLQEFRHSFECLKDSIYLNGQYIFEPEIIKYENRDQNSDELINDVTQIKFAIYPEEVNILSNYSSDILPDEIITSIKKFRKDYPRNKKTGFLMMKFEDSPAQKKLIKIVKQHFQSYDIKVLRADDKWYAEDVLPNIKTYMHGCNFGVAIFDRINTQYFNPNVSLEIGYMMAMNKPVLLLKDKSMASLQTDLVSKLYHEYDFQNPEITLQLAIDKWIRDYELI